MTYINHKYILSLKIKKGGEDMQQALIRQSEAISFNNDFFKSFIDYAQVKDTTIQGYKVCIRQFINYLQDNNIHTPTRNDIKAYAKYIENQNYTNGTKHQYLRAVKHFFKWLSSERLIS